MDAAKLLEKTADVLEERGHAKCVLEDCSGAVCLMGAMNVVEHGVATVLGWGEEEILSSTRAEADRALLTYLGLTVNDVRFGCACCTESPALREASALVDWNNADEREQFEVTDACRHTAKVLRGG